jgi:predicted nucleic acid-binding protein
MVVISDTSAITSLLKIGREQLLKDLYSRVAIPEGVRDELLKFHTNLPAFIVVKRAEDREKVQALQAILDKGEAEAVVLATELRAEVFIVDEQKARTIAIQMGLPVIGLLGAITVAKRRGLIELAAPIIKELEEQADFRISDELKATVLASVGEA